MSTNVRISNLSKKYMPKKYLHSEKIIWGQQCNNEQRRAFQVQVTFSVLDGSVANIMPNIGFSLKLGNNSFFIAFDDISDLQSFQKQLNYFIDKYSSVASEVVVQEKSTYLKRKYIAPKNTALVDTRTGEILEDLDGINLVEEK